MAANEAPGTIVNISMGPEHSFNVCPTYTDTAIKNAIIAAAQAGIMVITSAGNTHCDVALTDWKSISEAFVVGGLQANQIHSATPANQDRVIVDYSAGWGSGWGENISSWAPAEFIATLTTSNPNYSGGVCIPGVCGYNGTSYASPLVAGIAAVACSSSPGSCSVNPVLALFSAFRATGTTGGVYNEFGVPISSSTTPSRSIVIWQQW